MSVDLKFFRDRTDPLVALLVAIFALLTWWQTLPPDGAWPPDLDGPSRFSATAPGWFQCVAPALDTPLVGGPSLYAIAAPRLARIGWQDGTRFSALSAILAAASIGFVVVFARRAGLSRWAAVGGALALAFAPGFWMRATSAGAYSLLALLLVSALVTLWAQGKPWTRWSPLVALVLFALAAGQHPPLLVWTPAITAVILTHVAPGSRWWIAAAAMVCVLVALTQHAASVSASMGACPPDVGRPPIHEAVMQLHFPTNAGWAFFDGATESWSARLSNVTRTVTSDLSVVGSVLVTIGLFAAFRGRVWVLASLAGGVVVSVGLAAFARESTLGATMLPLSLACWFAAASGIDWIGRAGHRVFAIGVALVFAASQLGAGALSVRTRDATETRYVDALVDALPARAALVAEDLWLDRLFLWRSFEAAHQAPARVPQDAGILRKLHAEGMEIEAFTEARRRLSAAGLAFVRKPLLDAPLDHYLEGLSHDAVVAIATTPGVIDTLLERRTTPFESIGGVVPLYGRSHWAYGVIGSRRASGPAREALRSDTVLLHVDAGEMLNGVQAPVSVDIRSEEAGAQIAINGEPWVRAERGAAVVVLTPRGEAEIVQVADAPALRMPFSPRLHPLGIVSDVLACATLMPGVWTDLSHLGGSGRLTVTPPSTPWSNLEIVAARERPFHPSVSDADQHRLTLEQYGMSDADAAGGFRAAVAGGPPLDLASVAQSHVAYFNVFAGRRPRAAFEIHFGGIPKMVLARLVPELPNRPAPVTMCDVALDADLLFSQAPHVPSAVPLGSPSSFLGDGWHGPEHTGSETFRWTSATESELFVIRGSADDLLVQVEAIAAAPMASRPTLALRVNGSLVGSHDMREGRQRYEWHVPASVLKRGTNQLFLVNSPLQQAPGGDPRILGMAVASIVISPAKVSR